MTQALYTLNLMANGKAAIAILGDMLELGQESDQLHKKIGNIAATTNLSRLYLFGKQAKHICQGAFENGFEKKRIFWGAKDETAGKVLQQAQRGDWILFKGSRGMAMETIISDIKTLISKEKNQK